MGSAVVYGLISAALYYFLWYRLNFKYFDRRLVCVNPPSEEEREQYMQNKAAAKVKDQQEYKVKTAEELLNDFSLEANHNRDEAKEKSIPTRVCYSNIDPNAPDPNAGIRYEPPSEKDDEPVWEGLEFEYDQDDEYDDEIDQEVKTPNFCRKCGNKLAPDSIFCSNCGTKVI